MNPGVLCISALHQISTSLPSVWNARVAHTFNFFQLSAVGGDIRWTFLYKSENDKCPSLSTPTVMCSGCLCIDKQVSIHNDLKEKQHSGKAGPKLVFGIVLDKSALLRAGTSIWNS
ncbi:hypothetical protein E3U43_013957 [Larimichthys crocea]|uniref:Uncharacterized protein n=1 Tax=Larimichthys crocea TaxID=215358 RepID=A0ACD3RB14_LARCR|nr:hypothetical protein E3U43_013957 [Larimichthys crocea]